MVSISWSERGRKVRANTITHELCWLSKGLCTHSFVIIYAAYVYNSLCMACTLILHINTKSMTSMFKEIGWQREGGL